MRVSTTNGADNPSATTRLLELAINALDEGGEASVRINDVIDAAGVGPPTLYRAFGSREGLIVAAQIERFRRSLWVEPHHYAMLTTCDTAAEFREAVIAVVDGITASDRTGYRRTRLHVLGTSITRPELIESLLALEDQFRDVIQPILDRAHDRGWIRADIDTNTWALWFLDQVNGWANIELHSCSVMERAPGWRDIARDSVVRSLFGTTNPSTVS